MPAADLPKCAYVADETPEAQQCLQAITDVNWCDPPQAEIIVVIGGDGFMLRAIHQFYRQSIRLYGLNTGRFGFLLNPVPQANTPLMPLIRTAESMHLIPIQLTAQDKDDNTHCEMAFNEVTITRQGWQALDMSISIDGVCRLPEYIGDGLLVSTPAGSTAYNLSAGGPVLPLSANVLSLTTLAPYRPRRWRGVLLDHRSVLEVKVQQTAKRPAIVAADFHEIPHVVSVHVQESSEHAIELLFNPDHSLAERIISEQFARD